MSSKFYPDLELNYQPFTLFWLDAEVNLSEHNKTVQKQLRTIGKQLNAFDDVEQCRRMIEAFNKQERLILIVSGRLGQMLVPDIHSLPQLTAIYVYCRDKTLHEQWARQFCKVKINSLFFIDSLELFLFR